MFPTHRQKSHTPSAEVPRLRKPQAKQPPPLRRFQFLSRRFSPLMRMRKAKAQRVGIGVGAGGCLEAAPSAVVVVVVVAVASTVRLRWPGVAMIHAPTTTRLLHHPSLTFIISLNTTTKRKTHTLNHCSLSLTLSPLSLSLYQSTHHQ